MNNLSNILNYCPTDIINFYILPYIGTKQDEEVASNRRKVVEYIGKNMNTYDDDDECDGVKEINGIIRMYLMHCKKCGNYEDEYATGYQENILCKCSYEERLEVYKQDHYCNNCDRTMLGDCIECNREWMLQFLQNNRLYW